MSSRAFSLVVFGLLVGCGGQAGVEDGGGAGCPAQLPTAGDACADPGDCAYDDTVPDCPSTVAILARCVEQQWHIHKPVTCAPPEVLSCDPVGSWSVTTTGPYVSLPDMGDGSVFESYSSFELALSQQPNGWIYADGYVGTLTNEGCALSVSRIFAEDCYELDGQQACETIDGQLVLDFSQAPVTGTMKMRCSGECDNEAIAPVQATPL
jgi:hypothetical protein